MFLLMMVWSLPMMISPNSLEIKELKEITNVFSLEQNDVSERFNYTAMDAIRLCGTKAILKKVFGPQPCYALYTPGIGSVMGKKKKNTKTMFELYCNRKPFSKTLKGVWFNCICRNPKTNVGLKRAFRLDLLNKPEDTEYGYLKSEK